MSDTRRDLALRRALRHLALISCFAGPALLVPGTPAQASVYSPNQYVSPSDQQRERMQQQRDERRAQREAHRAEQDARRAAQRQEAEARRRRDS